MKRNIHNQAELAAVGVCICMLLGCASVERFSERQQRRVRYAQLLHRLPGDATRAQLYSVLPPLCKPTVPDGATILGVGPFATESYPIDSDYEVVATFIYAHFKWTDPKDRFSLRIMQSPSDRLFGRPPSIRSRSRDPNNAMECDDYGRSR